MALGNCLSRLFTLLRQKLWRSFPGSQAYWEQRYASGDNSGSGSYGKSATLKADIVNEFVAQHNVISVIEFGCGDGNQLTLSNYPHYLGFDISETAISLCRSRFSSDDTKSFRLMSEYNGENADLVLSLDVIYHLVEEDVFRNYMATLFNASSRYVIIYSSNTDHNPWYMGRHIKRRKFSTWISTHAPRWQLIETHQGYQADFYIYEKI